MDKQLLESTEFYQRRYQNFSTLIIFPILLLIIFILIISFLGKKETVIKTNAEIVPTKIIGQIQSTANNEIVENYLKENKRVKKGDKLLVYRHDQDKSQLDLLNNKLIFSKKQIKKINQLRQGIENAENPFKGGDEYGYSEVLKNYFAQVDTLKEEAEKENKSVDNQNTAIKESKRNIDSAISKNNQKLSNYQELRNAIENDSRLSDKNVFIKLYKSYVQQMNAHPEQKTNLKNQFLTEIETNIYQIENSTATLQTQKSGAGFLMLKSTSLQSKLEALKAEKLSNIDKEMISLNTTVQELKTKIRLAKKALSQATLVANETGILHVKENVEGIKKISNGTIIAEIYPRLQKSSSINLVFWISSTKIIGIKQAQKVRLTSYQKSPKSLTLTGRITEIAAAPNRTKNGNFYKVVAKTVLTKEQAKNIQYGLQGKATIITGEKTFFNYYKDKITNQ